MKAFLGFSLESGQVDYVTALVPSKSSDFDPSGLSLVRQPGQVTVTVTGVSGNRRQLLLTGGIARSDEHIEARYTLRDTSGKEQTITLGSLSLVSYDRKQIDLKIVPVNGATVPANLAQQINALYRQAVAGFRVEVLPNLEVEDLSGNVTFSNADNAFLSRYTSHMNKVIRTFKRAGNPLDGNTYYLFLIPNPTTDPRQGYMPINGQCGFVFLNNVSVDGVARVAAHELGHGVFRLYHTFSSDNRYVLPEGTTDNLMDYNGGTALYKYQWDYIHDPQTMLFAWAEEEEEGAAKAIKEYFFTIDGKKALEIDIEALEAEFNNIKTLSNEKLNNYSFKTIQLYVIGTEKNNYKISTMYIRNGENKGEVPGIIWDLKGAKEKEIQFRSKYIGKESIYMYYTSQIGGEIITYPVYNIEIVRVSPNIAYKQEGKVNCIIREDKKTYEITNVIELSGRKVSLRPVFFTYDEKNNDIEDINAIFDRNRQCSYLVNAIKFEDKKYDTNLTLDWIEFELSSEESTYEILIGEETIKGIIKTAIVSPFVTVIRGKSNEETGYYIEDYYSTSFGGTSPFPSLRDQNNTMKTGEFNVLGSAYKIPIVHYKNQCNVKLELAEIPRKEVSSPLQYKVGDKVIELGKEFTIQTPPNGTILDIKDIDGNIKGKIEFRQITEPLLTPTLNIVTINTEIMEVSLSTVVNDLNAIYNTMNVSWQEGNHIILNINVKNLDIKNDEHLKLILNYLKKHEDYKDNQYYMIISTNSDNFGGFAAPSLEDNWFVIQKTYDKRIPAHELGHCNGLDEYAVNIGLLPSTRRSESSGQNMQHLTTNVMGYSMQGLTSANPLMDFYSWQIPIIRQQISQRINKKQ